MNIKTIFIAGCVSGFISVAMGAFGAHGLKNRLSPEMMVVYETGVRYQFYHTFALFITYFTYAHTSSKYILISGVLFVLGILLFSGSLYILSFTSVRAFGMITPLGGLCFLAGWALLGIGAAQSDFRI